MGNTKIVTKYSDSIVQTLQKHWLQQQGENNRIRLNLYRNTNIITSVEVLLSTI